MSDWIGDQNSVYKTLGASSHTEKERQQDDYYATDPRSIDYLLEKAHPQKDIWECACGEGHLSKRLMELGFNVRSTDLVYRGFGAGGVDFLSVYAPFSGDIITNPPYKYAKEFVEHSLEILQPGSSAYMFLKLQFLEGKARRALFETGQLKRVYVSTSRILCAKNGDFETAQSSAVAYCWYQFEKGYHGPAVIEWIN